MNIKLRNKTLKQMKKDRKKRMKKGRWAEFEKHYTNRFKIDKKDPKATKTKVICNNCNNNHKTIKTVFGKYLTAYQFWYLMDLNRKYNHRSMKKFKCCNEPDYDFAEFK